MAYSILLGGSRFHVSSCALGWGGAETVTGGTTANEIDRRSLVGMHPDFYHLLNVFTARKNSTYPQHLK